MHRRSYTWICVLLLACGLLVLSAGAARASSYTVTNTNDSGPGSLRDAIDNSNANPALDGAANTISFNIPGSGLQTIHALSALPDITVPVIIDGYTQPGATPNTQASGDNANLLIELDGTNAGYVQGLNIRTSNSIVRGLVINRFGHEQISVSQANNTVAGNFIGTDPNGTAALNLANGSDGIIVGNAGPVPG